MSKNLKILIFLILLGILISVPFVAYAATFGYSMEYSTTWENGYSTGAWGSLRVGQPQVFGLRITNKNSPSTSDWDNNAVDYSGDFRVMLLRVSESINGIPGMAFGGHDLFEAGVGGDFVLHQDSNPNEGGAETAVFNYVPNLGTVNAFFAPDVWTPSSAAEGLNKQEYRFKYWEAKPANPASYGSIWSFRTRVSPYNGRSTSANCSSNELFGGTGGLLVPTVTISYQAFGELKVNVAERGDGCQPAGRRYYLKVTKKNADGTWSPYNGLWAQNENKVWTYRSEDIWGKTGASSADFYIKNTNNTGTYAVSAQLKDWPGNISIWGASVQWSYPPTADIKANNSNGPITINYNTSATLSWTSTDATSCTASNGWSGSKGTSGSESTGNLTSSKTYTLSCTGPGGSASDSVTVNVSSPPPTVDIKANSSDGPITISYNSSATLSWTSSDATSCTASDGWSGSKGTSGSESTGNLTSSKTYTITCTGPGGSASDSVTVNVSSPSSLSVTLSASPSSGTAPFTPTLTGTATSSGLSGTYNWTFYADRNDSGTNITSGYCAKYDATNNNPQSTTNCSYGSTGTYTAKVIVERGGLAAEARVAITVSSTPPSENAAFDLGKGVNEATSPWSIVNSVPPNSFVEGDTPYGLIVNYDIPSGQQRRYYHYFYQKDAGGNFQSKGGCSWPLITGPYSWYAADCYLKLSERIPAPAGDYRLIMEVRNASGVVLFSSTKDFTVTSIAPPPPPPPEPSSPWQYFWQEIAP